MMRSGVINPLNAELNPIYHFLALLGAHPIPRVSGVRVNQSYANGYLGIVDCSFELRYRRNVYLAVVSMKYSFPRSLAGICLFIKAGYAVMGVVFLDCTTIVR
jgi:hypothetical protein